MFRDSSAWGRLVTCIHCDGPCDRAGSGMVLDLNSAEGLSLSCVVDDLPFSFSGLCWCGG